MSKTVTLHTTKSIYTLASKGLIEDVFLVVTEANEKAVRDAETIQIKTDGEKPISKGLKSFSIVGQGYHPRNYPQGWTVRYPSFRLHLKEMETPEKSETKPKSEKS